MKSKNLIDVGKHAPEEPGDEWMRARKPMIKRRTIRLNEDDEGEADDAAARLRRRGSGDSEYHSGRESPGSLQLTLQQRELQRLQDDILELVAERSE